MTEKEFIERSLKLVKNFQMEVAKLEDEYGANTGLGDCNSATLKIGGPKLRIIRDEMDEDEPS